LRSREKIKDPVRISKENSSSASRIIDVLKKIKSPKQIRIPKETEYLIDKVIRRKIKMHYYNMATKPTDNDENININNIKKVG
jgi:hypothetical protein